MTPGASLPATHPLLLSMPLASCVPPSAPPLGICLHQCNFVSSLSYSYEQTRHTTISPLCCGALLPLHFSNSRPPHPPIPIRASPSPPLFTDRYFVGCVETRCMCARGNAGDPVLLYHLILSLTRSPPPPQHTQPCFWFRRCRRAGADG